MIEYFTPTNIALFLFGFITTLVILYYVILFKNIGDKLDSDPGKKYHEKREIVDYKLRK